MANVSAADVKRLRDATGAGMMDSKKALEEADGDFDQAVELLRVKGGKKVQKRRRVRVAVQRPRRRRRGRDDRARLRDRLRRQERAVPDARRRHRRALRCSAATDAPHCSGETLKDGKTVEESIEALAAVIGEKLELRRAVKLDGQVATYLHRKASDLPPQVGVLVQFEGDDLEAARGAAMQVAALRAALPHPRRGPGRRRRARAARRRGEDPRRGQARGGAPQDRRGPPQRLLQRQRPARAGVGARGQEDGQAGARRGRRDRHRASRTSRSAGPDDAVAPLGQDQRRE